MYTKTEHGRASILNTLNQLNKKVRKALLHTLLSVVKKQQQFDSLDIILIATNRLSETHYNVEENKSIVSTDTEDEYVLDDH